jgi:hypothetical protein
MGDPELEVDVAEENETPNMQSEGNASHSASGFAEASKSPEPVVRHRTLTNKGQEYQVQRRSKAFHGAFIAWKKTMAKEEVSREEIERSLGLMETNYSQQIEMLGSSQAEKSTAIMENVRRESQKLIEILECQDLDVEASLDDMLSEFTEKENSEESPLETAQNSPQTQQSAIVTPVKEDETQAISDLISQCVRLSKMPVPEPPVFKGDPMEFHDFERGFRTLITSNCTNPEERIYWLKRYVSGPAKQAIEGFFWGNSEKEYQDAWATLKKRFGQPFIVSQAYRKKIDAWPKIGAKDATALRDFADFLESCKNAMPHIPGLKVLDDCKENQIMLGKLPEWVVTRWSRKATQMTEDVGMYPPFAEFVAFLQKEALVVYNPVTS